MQRRLAAALTIAVLSLSGCGGDGGGEEAPPTPTEGDTIASEQPTQAPATEAPPTKPEARTYTVRSGDTLSEIAERFDTTVQAIVKANKLKDRDALQVGQNLKIPPKG